MKPIGNVLGKVDLSKPFTQEDIERALKPTKPVSIREVAKAGYGLELLQPTPVAKACGMGLKVLPRFVKGGE